MATMVQRFLAIGDSMFPIGLLALYFMHAGYKAFPMTAYMTWYVSVIQFDYAEMPVFTSALFSVWNWKPVFGLISDLYPIFGYQRKGYIFLCEVCAGISMIVTGIWVTTKTWAYVVRISDNIFECFAQLMLDIALVDMVSFDASSVSAGRAQSLKMIASWAGCLLAHGLIGKILYRKSVYTPENQMKKAGHYIAWNSVFAFAAAAVCLFALHEARTAKAGSLMDFYRAVKDGFKQKIRVMYPVIPTMLFFFLCKCLPDDTDNWSMYSYSVVGPECYNGMQIASDFGGILSGVVYMAFCTKLCFKKVLVISTLASIVCVVPKLFMMPQKINSLPMDVCHYSQLQSFISSFATQFSLLPLLVIATFYCPKEKRLHGLVYSCYIGCFDLGSTVSGPITSVINKALDIKFGSLDKLWIFELIVAGCQLLVILFCFLLPKKSHGWEKTEAEELEEQADDDDDEDNFKKETHYVAATTTTSSPVAVPVAMPVSPLKSSVKNID